MTTKQIETMKDLTERQQRALRGVDVLRGPAGVYMQTLRSNGNRRDVVDRLCDLGLVYVADDHGDRDWIRFDLTSRGREVLATDDRDGPEKLTTSQVQKMLGLGSPDATRVQLRRWAISATGRDVVSGEKEYPATAVRNAMASRPGRGARTDLAAARPTGPDCPNACEDGEHVPNCPTVTGVHPETSTEYRALYGIG